MCRRLKECIFIHLSIWVEAQPSSLPLSLPSGSRGGVGGLCGKTSLGLPAYHCQPERLIAGPEGQALLSLCEKRAFFCVVGEPHLYELICTEAQLMASSDF